MVAKEMEKIYDFFPSKMLLMDMKHIQVILILMKLSYLQKVKI